MLKQYSEHPPPSLHLTKTQTIPTNTQTPDTRVSRARVSVYWTVLQIRIHNFITILINSLNQELQSELQSLWLQLLVDIVITFFTFTPLARNRTSVHPALACRDLDQVPAAVVLVWASGSPNLATRLLHLLPL